MNTSLPKLFLITFFCSIGSFCHAQSLSRSVVCAAATTVNVGNYSITYILGEAVGDLFSNQPNGTFLTSGFAQPDISLQEIMAANNNSNANFVLFPNPAPAVSTIKLGFKSSLPVGRYSIAIIDASGKILQTKEVYFKPSFFAYQEFVVASYAKGVYYVRVIGDNNFKTALSFEKQ